MLIFSGLVSTNPNYKKYLSGDETNQVKWSSVTTTSSKHVRHDDDKFFLDIFLSTSFALLF